MRKVAYSLIVVLFSLVFGSYQNGWYGLTSEEEKPVAGIILHNTTDLIEIKFYIPGFYIQQDEDSTDYYHIFLKDESRFTDSVGLPQIPVIVRNIAIPECDSFKVTVRYYSPTSFDSILVYPVPDIVCDSTGCYEVFEKNETFYQEDTLYPGYDYEISQGYIRRQKVMRFTLTPFRYDAAHRILKVYSEVDFRVRYFGSSDSMCVDAGPLNPLCHNVVMT